jgi:putative acetyltransferase
MPLGHRREHAATNHESFRGPGGYDAWAPTRLRGDRDTSSMPLEPNPEETELTLRDGRRARIRPASVRDAAAVVAMDRLLAERGDGMVISPDQVRSEEQEATKIDASYAEGRASTTVVAELADPEPRVVACGDLRQLEPVRCEHVGILSVGVHPDVHRLGVGRAVMAHLIDRARAFGLLRLELYVRADNTAAIAMYRTLGFAHEATRARFVRLGDGTFVDDLIFTLWLGPPAP